MKILHVLTLMGAKGEYGGPVKVAREISSFANYVDGINSRIIGGTNISKNTNSPNENLIHVKKWIRTTSVSGFFSTKFAIIFLKEFRNSDVLHLHFARDLIQIFAGFICLISKKPYITQTHGMIRTKYRRTKIFDNIFVKPILRNAKYCLVLSEYELNDLREVENELNFVVVPNGIDSSKTSKYPINRTQQKTRIAFCSRLHHTKGLDKFINLAVSLKDSDDICFEIYGPDGGELSNTLKQIDYENQFRQQPIKYMGAIPPDSVGETLQKIDLLVLPSKYDPYPMIVLESLAHGTPVLISNVCGNSSEVSSIDSLMVSMDNSDEDFLNRAGMLLEKYRDPSARVNLQTSAAIIFDLSNVGKTLIRIYKDTSIDLTN